MITIIAFLLGIVAGFVLGLGYGAGIVVQWMREHGRDTPRGLQ